MSKSNSIIYPCCVMLIEMTSALQYTLSNDSGLNFNSFYMGNDYFSESLYVCGGYNGYITLSSVEVLSKDGSSWKQLPPMNHRRSDFGLLPIKNRCVACRLHFGHRCIFYYQILGKTKKIYIKHNKSTIN